ncbi:DNA topoisomerase VI subunit B [Candidatus Woesearchaeota archaeon]|nr:DNA topoisomerase VI subunit B [Candidatus Woesearchaeota archaeon]
MSQTKLTGEEPKANISKAEEMATKQREISVAAFFEKNRHLLGFDNPRKALLTTIKEAVDNSLDACEEASILPEIIVEVIDLGNDRFRIIVEDNGPGIVKKQLPKIFAKLLYGSKFHKLAQTRGQQGIGISASVMYGHLTTGKPARITSKIGSDQPAIYHELHIDTNTNKPIISKDEKRDWPHKEHGTRIELDLEGAYIKGKLSIDEYLKETAIVNPHLTIIYTNPKAEQFIFARVTDDLPPKPVEIKPHPYGIELGMLIRMLSDTETRTLQSFLTTEFTRVGAGTAKEICEHASLLPNTKPRTINREMSEKIMEGIKKTKIIAPPTDCISPIGSELLEKGIRKEINAEFYTAVTRPPAVYRGNPFVIEVGIAYGGEQPKDKPVTLMRYANRVPLQYQQGAGAVVKSVSQTKWKSYGMNQSGSNLPVGPMTIAVHMASVWVPFTSESKEAIANYEDIIKEMKLAIQECGRKLASYVNKKKRVGYEIKKRSFIEKYIPHVGEALIELLGLDKSEIEGLDENLRFILEDTRGKVEEVGKIDNPEYDAEFAKIGKEEKEDSEETESDDKEGGSEE